MITIFTIPKGFKGNFKTIQRNAILSWKNIEGANIIICGDEEGLREFALENSLIHLDIEKNEFGTPLLNDCIRKSIDYSKDNILCYVNADIILPPDFFNVISLINFNRFLAIGERWDVDIDFEIDFNEKDWFEKLKNTVLKKGSPHPRWGIDFFVFKKGIYDDMPAFAVGRTIFDNWFIYKAKFEKIPVIDCSYSLLTIHQNHDYQHYRGNIKKGKEAKRNKELARDMDKVYTIDDADFFIVRKKIIRKKSWMRKNSVYNIAKSFYYHAGFIGLAERTLRFFMKRVRR